MKEGKINYDQLLTIADEMIQRKDVGKFSQPIEHVITTINIDGSKYELKLVLAPARE